MQKYLKFAGIPLLAVMVLALSMFSGCRKTSSDVAKEAARVYPGRLGIRVQLRPVKAGEKLRYVQYASDNQTKVSAVVEFVSGKSGYINYRTEGPGKGKILDATVLYPLAQKAKSRQVARLVQLGTDGRSILKDEQFREDGTLFHKGDRTPNGLFESFDYAKDGHSVTKHQQFVYSPGIWNLSLEENFRPDATLESVLTLLSNGDLETKTFSKTNLLVSVAVMNQWKNDLVTEYYDEDGKTLVKVTDQKPYEVSVETYRNGVLRQSLEWNYDFRTLRATFFNHEGKPKRRQQWSVSNSNGDAPKDLSNYKLNHVDVVNADGVVTESIDIADDGHVQNLRLADPALPGNAKAGTTKTFRADGSLEKVVVSDKDGKQVSTEDHTAAENIRPDVSDKLLRQPVVEQQPNKLMPTYRDDGPYDMD